MRRSRPFVVVESIFVCTKSAGKRWNSSLPILPAVSKGETRGDGRRRHVPPSVTISLRKEAAASAGRSGHRQSLKRREESILKVHGSIDELSSSPSAALGEGDPGLLVFSSWSPDAWPVSSWSVVLQSGQVHRYDTRRLVGGVRSCCREILKLGKREGENVGALTRSCEAVSVLLSLAEELTEREETAEDIRAECQKSVAVFNILKTCRLAPSFARLIRETASSMTVIRKLAQAAVAEMNSLIGKAEEREVGVVPSIDAGQGLDFCPRVSDGTGYAVKQLANAAGDARTILQDPQLAQEIAFGVGRVLREMPGVLDVGPKTGRLFVTGVTWGLAVAQLRDRQVFVMLRDEVTKLIDQEDEKQKQTGGGGTNLNSANIHQPSVSPEVGPPALALFAWSMARAAMLDTELTEKICSFAVRHYL
eukprot:Cvel_12686.t2-p1 / transcript=Cvel_12686.t2 / gene=Cvel_12686 / organism=Chromera_velia_CCMP2878 / gene_product=hypothetical protein / transcript_product=hypothetical protein / location=Cvel_scaffold839:29141-30401(+) / protein_length=420 / sequence_SO=supercontig / SO=protein_coding / is_pseudo=false